MPERMFIISWGYRHSYCKIGNTNGEEIQQAICSLG